MVHVINDNQMRELLSSLPTKDPRLILNVAVPVEIKPSFNSLKKIPKKLELKFIVIKSDASTKYVTFKVTKPSDELIEFIWRSIYKQGLNENLNFAYSNAVFILSDSRYSKLYGISLAGYYSSRSSIVIVEEHEKLSYASRISFDQYLILKRRIYAHHLQKIHDNCESFGINLSLALHYLSKEKCEDYITITSASDLVQKCSYDTMKDENGKSWSQPFFPEECKVSLNQLEELDFFEINILKNGKIQLHNENIDSIYTNKT